MAKPTKRPAPVPASARPRSALERLSTPALLRLHAMPRWAFPAFTALLLVGGLLVPNSAVAAVLLGLLALSLAWLVALSWPRLNALARLMRVAVIGGLVFVIVNRVQGRA